MDFNALQHKLFAMDPTDPAADLAKLRAQAQGGAATDNVAPATNYLNETAQVKEGSLKMDRDYSVSDFAALAGVTTTSTPVTEPVYVEPAYVAETYTKPVVETIDKDARIAQLEERVARLEQLLSETIAPIAPKQQPTKQPELKIQESLKGELLRKLREAENKRK